MYGVLTEGSDAPGVSGGGGGDKGTGDRSALRSYPGAVGSTEMAARTGGKDPASRTASWALGRCDRELSSSFG